MTEQSATLKIGDKSVDLAVKSGTIGPDVIDIGALYKHTGFLHVRSWFHLDRIL